MSDNGAAPSQARGMPSKDYLARYGGSYARSSTGHQVVLNAINAVEALSGIVLPSLEDELAAARELAALFPAFASGLRKYAARRVEAGIATSCVDPLMTLATRVSGLGDQFVMEYAEAVRRRYQPLADELRRRDTPDPSYLAPDRARA